MTIAVWRLGFSLVVVGAIVAASGGWRQWRRLDARGLALAAGAGVALAFHFWMWNASVTMTTVAASVVLVNIQPVVVAGISTVWLRERPDRRQWAGIAMAMGGAALVGWGDFSGGAHALAGDALALAAGCAAALYYLVGRRLRQSLDLWPYVALVYGACFVTLLVIAAVERAPVLHQPPRALAIYLGLALGPMLLGHTGMNWALKHLPAYVVNLTVLGEPVGATLLAALLPGIREIPGPWTVLGGTVVIVGILVAMPRRAPELPAEIRETV